MNSKFCIAALLLVSSSGILADESDGLSQALRGVASDLAALHKEIQSTSASADAKRDWASARGIHYVTITKDNAQLKYGADESASSYMKASIGQTYKVIDKANDWYAVQIEKPTKGVEAAWVNASDVAPKIQQLASTLSENKNAADRIYEQIMDSVKKIKDKYDDSVAIICET